MNYPSEQEAREILKNYPLPDIVREHSEQVSGNCRIMGKQILQAGNNVNLSLLISLGLLHDIGRYKYSRENGYSSEEDRHEHETGRLLRELGYPKFAELARRHPLGGLTPEETRALAYPEPIDLTPIHPHSKILCIADKIRPQEGIITLDQILEKYRTSTALRERYFKHLPGLLKKTIERVSLIWHELESLGMRNPPINMN